jgi:protein TonB
MTITLRSFMPYGAPDLQEAAARHMVRALSLGSALATTLFALAWWLSLMLVHPALERAKIEAVPFTVDPNFHVLQPPPPVAPVPMVKPVAAKTVDAIPVPVKDTPEVLDRTIPSQGQTDAGPIATNGGREGTGAPPVTAKIDDGPINQPGEVPFPDELPVEVRAVKPEYPDLAKQAGVEGLVIVDVLVGRDGRVQEARIDPRINILLLNESALVAARKWVFTPAMMKGLPVSVWIKIPFRFTLH